LAVWFYFDAYLTCNFYSNLFCICVIFYVMPYSVLYFHMARLQEYCFVKLCCNYSEIDWTKFPFQSTSKCCWNFVCSDAVLPYYM